ncbi:Uu.00g051780.m01.CDS01 [Anthostomella pinea]|uniref:Uu.00g051780.m01.CDS01 n=1 Tax=Anthostomella pinea TaxID=933095 RepID=A0AAI8VXC0_9PEZI|nr:Uu.00g051780.m01.CDS01 [Anthostomella pinea]
MASLLGAPLLLLFYLVALILPTNAENILQSSSLNTCQDNSGFTASLFNVVYSPKDEKAYVNISAISTIEANVLFDVLISIYGYSFFHKVINPCDVNLAGFCPMVSGKLGNPFSLDIDPSATGVIPSIAYQFPDLDAKVRIFINATSGTKAGTSVACIEATVSNGKTVDLLGVKWASAIVTGLALASSAVISGLGHSNAASHVAASALALTSYFQAQAMVGLVGIKLPPVVQSWTQDFQWSMGIINVGFMQDIFTWYQRSTGGTAATIIDTLENVSVEVQKRAAPLIAPAAGLFRRATAMVPRSVLKHASSLAKRGNIQTDYGSYVVYGIQRVAFRAGIETTNLFMTGLIFFYIIMVATALFVAAWKGFCEVAAKARWIKSDTFLEFRNGWLTVLKGILFRITLIGHPPVTILCLWELTQKDSPAEMVLAVFFLLFVNGALGFAAYKVIRIAHRSVSLHRNPAYILFSDPQTLNKWGFLYIQFRASAYYFIIPLLCYTVVKSFFISLAQRAGTVQAIALLIIEAGALITAAVMRPWMDKKMSSFNIAICSVNFVNAIFLLIFTNIFGQPDIVNGVVGVVLWILNAVCTLVLLIMLIASTLIVFFTDNPDGRYKFMADDRTSFMKSQSQLGTTNELDALGATARGEKPGYGSGMDLEDGDNSIAPSSFRQQPHSRSTSFNRTGAPSTAHSTSSNSHHDRPRTSVDPAMPFLSSGANISRNGSPSNVSAGNRSQHNAR